MGTGGQSVPKACGKRWRKWKTVLHGQSMRNFAKRIDAENTRQNRRIEALEQSVDRFGWCVLGGAAGHQHGGNAQRAGAAGGTAGQAGRQARRKLERYGKRAYWPPSVLPSAGAGCGHCHDVDQIKEDTYI